MFSSNAVGDLWRRADAILSPRFSQLIQEHREGPPPVRRHRLIDQLIALGDARDGRLNPIRENAALASLPEIDAVLSFAEEAKATASLTAWNEVRRGLASAAEYLHSVGVIQVASLLRVHHSAMEFQVTSGTTREPDLILVVTTGGPPLAVEVKAPDRLWQSTTSLDRAEGRHLIRNALANAGTVKGQLRADRPSVLALTGLLMAQGTYDTLVGSFEDHLQVDGRRTPHLLGLAVSNLRWGVEAAPGRVSPLVEQQSVLRRNPTYRGPLQIDDDWAGPWRLVNR